MDPWSVIGWVRRLLGSSSDDGIDREQARLLADCAPGDSITVPALTNDRGYSSRPLLEYLEDDEQPAFLLSGTEVIVEDEILGMVQEHPTMQTQVLITDQRVVIVIGNPRSDDLWGIPIDSIDQMQVETVRRQGYLTIDATEGEEQKTFYVNVMIQVDTDELSSAIGFVNAHDEPDAE